ncbi:DgyrCDS5702 [Dimorphilus gyrociliatus]|uniref:S-adenosylmethionine synthase n=1 Tax=Dimorphilus gyrociliatus TaxID=2664684 RepID=A0A7I8VKQ1_9ANNE|nr:DgyrCDS5702 [Dimorphilus gyrociliatus]
MSISNCKENQSKIVFFSSESVGEGNPDKICDQISDAVLDAHLERDPNAKVACETVMQNSMVFLLGEISSTARVDYEQLVRQTIKKIGYTHSDQGCDYKLLNVITALEEQSPDIAESVHLGKEEESIGAGDQGIMFGYATDETDECMPLTIVIAHKLNMRIAQLRKTGELKWALPDSKTQVTVEYCMNGGYCVPKRVSAVVVNVQQRGGDKNSIKNDIIKIVKETIPNQFYDENTVLHLQQDNAATRGPFRSCGLTGRKIIVDTYGGWGAHGGGAFSGKDFSKVDRSAAYAARWIAKSLVKAGLCRRVLVQLSYAIGIAEPLSVFVNSYGTGIKSDNDLINIVKRNFDLRPGIIVRDLNLKAAIYKRTACYGHFGRKEFTWEQPKNLIY